MWVKIEIDPETKLLKSLVSEFEFRIAKRKRKTRMMSEKRVITRSALNQYH